MNDSVNELITKIRRLEDSIEDEFIKSRERYHVQLRGKIAAFAEEIVAKQKTFKMHLPQFIFTANWRYVLVSPVIYSVILPIALVDLWVTLYQHACFRIYGIPLVKRSTYLVYDRHHLAYLNAVEKLNCLYCSYGNGVFAYAREVAGRTEQFWCPIKHAIRVRDPHQRYLKFLEYGDAEGYRAGLDSQRKDAQDQPDAVSGVSSKEGGRS